MTTEQTSRVLRLLAIAAGAMALVAAFAGSPYITRHGTIDVDALSRAVVHEDDHVTAVELAGWIKERRRGLRVIDVRSRDEYEAYHVPGAERVSIDSLPATPFHADDTIVLYSEGGAHAAQAWVFLRALGYDKVYFLRGGLYEWLEQVMSPGLRANAPEKDSVAFAEVASLSRYFGGAPRFGVTDTLSGEAITLPFKPAHAAGGTSPFRESTGASAATSLALKVRRRGC